jgi:hypothetical protein
VAMITLVTPDAAHASEGLARKNVGEREDAGSQFSPDKLYNRGPDSPDYTASTTLSEVKIELRRHKGLA